MSDETNHPFQAGVEVALVTRNYTGTSYSIHKVAKVHKSGRFCLEGTQQQYRPEKDIWGDSGGWTATATGSHLAYSKVELITDKLRAECAATKRQNRFKNVVYNLDRDTRHLAERVTDAHIADLERIYAELGGKVT